MSLHLDKTILVTHEGDGIVTFPVPFLSLTSPEGLRLQMKTSKELGRDQVMETPPWLNLLKMGGNLQNLLKKNGSFYVGLLQEGFLQNGVITLIGFMPPLETSSPNSTHIESKKIFKSIIQLDGDIICQIDRSILKEKNASELIEGYNRVQNQFLEGFNKVLKGLRLLIITTLSVLIPTLYLIWKLFP